MAKTFLFMVLFALLGYLTEFSIANCEHCMYGTERVLSLLFQDDNEIAAQKTLLKLSCCPWVSDDVASCQTAVDDRWQDIINAASIVSLY